MSTRRRAYVRIAACLFLIALSPARAPKAVAASLPAELTGPAVLDEWGNRFISLGASVPENPLRTQIRTTIAQLAMFDAVNAVPDGPYRPFASKPPSPCGASPKLRSSVPRTSSPGTSSRRKPRPSIVPITPRSPSFARALARSPMAFWSAKPLPMRCSRRASEITATIRTWWATRPAAARVCRASRRRPHSRIRRLRSFSSSRRSGMTTPRASVPMLRQRSAAGHTRPTTTRARTSVGPPTRIEPMNSLRRPCSGRHRRARCGAPTFAASPARWTS